jgi:hypothetical protein
MDGDLHACMGTGVFADSGVRNLLVERYPNGI